MGKIFKIESMGLLDGPGIRTVVFLCGCKLRCKYCHNPESWAGSEFEEITPEELMAKLKKFKPYYEKSGGGVTFSGGEPLGQSEFLIEMLKKCKEEGIHTCIDTAGVGDEKYYKEILSLADLVLFDIKALEKESYSKLCREDISKSLEFIKELNKSKVPVILRQVIVPGLNDTDEYMDNLKKYIKSTFKNVIATELLPYHKIGENKYRELGIEYTFSDVPAMDKSIVCALQEKYFGMEG